jgi:hypothetical protein
MKFERIRGSKREKSGEKEVDSGVFWVELCLEPSGSVLWKPMWSQLRMTWGSLSGFCWQPWQKITFLELRKWHMNVWAIWL